MHPLPSVQVASFQSCVRFSWLSCVCPWHSQTSSGSSCTESPGHGKGWPCAPAAWGFLFCCSACPARHSLTDGIPTVLGITRANSYKFVSVRMHKHAEREGERHIYTLLCALMVVIWLPTFSTAVSQSPLVQCGLSALLKSIGTSLVE